MTDYQVIDNKELSRFEIHKDGHVAFENYRLFDGGIAYTYTEVPEALGGQGIAAYLVKHILDDAAAKGLKVDPVCPYVRKYIDKHPEYQANTVNYSAPGE
ncbi:GNAT family N-acetyltransferase [Moraxella canis]|uniref:GNAT family N-acetyltransferase n=1 Tax=Moraxella canis TaxID=90239 RepID=A0ABZ0WY62_9GAMM|nr:GNAT family N-acetyltransferase [Moraxella canis]WQE04203.1 GNAT family N-acetyltransferase [Moraxella canis]